MVALGSLVGPSLGGILVHAFGWPSIFLINIPIGVLGFICAIVLIPEIFEKQVKKTFDVRGTALFVSSMLILFLGLLFVQEGRIPIVWLAPIVLVALTILWLFIRTERRMENPLLSVGLFRTHEFSTGLAAAYLTFIGMNATTLFIPFYLQNLLKFDAMKAGLVMSAYPIAMAVFSPLSGWLSDRISYRPLTVAGMTIATTGFILLATINETTSIPKLIILMGLLGAGAAIFMSPNTSSVMGSVPRAQLGIAGGANALFRNLGMVSGTTFSVLIFSLVSKININELGSGFNAQAFLRGLSMIFVFSAVCTFGSLVISFTRAVRFRKPAKAEK
jgi:MFS family permease